MNGHSFRKSEIRRLVAIWKRYERGEFAPGETEVAWPTLRPDGVIEKTLFVPTPEQERQWKEGGEHILSLIKSGGLKYSCAEPSNPSSTPPEVEHPT